MYEDKKKNNGISGLSIPYQIPFEATDRAQRLNAPASGICDDDDYGYADDTAIICWNEEDLQMCMTIFYQTFTDYGLNVNLTKTESMIINWNTSYDGTYPQSIISMNGSLIKNVTSFKYLGVWINYDSIHIGKDEVQHRVASAHNAFSDNRKLLTNQSIALSTRVDFLNALVRSRLTYGCHAWRPNYAELSKIESTYRFFLRCMLWNGHSRINPPSSEDDLEESIEDDNVDWHYKVTNLELYQKTKTKPIEDFHRKQQNNWISHIIRRRNDNICKILTFDSVKRTKRGRKTPSILERVIEHSGTTCSEYLRNSFNKRNLL